VVEASEAGSRLDGFLAKWQAAASAAAARRAIASGIVQVGGRAAKKGTHLRAGDTVGVTTFQATISGGPINATRPKHFFRDDGSMPEVVSLDIARPHGFQDLGQSEWASLVTERVRAKEADHRQRRADKGITVLGFGAKPARNRTARK
jgi:ribosomal protein S4